MDTLTLFSPAGVYEIATEAGPTYELTVAEDLDEAGVLLIDRQPGVPDERTEDTKFLRIYEAVFKLGEKGHLVTDGESENELNQVSTKLVKSIEQVA